MPNTLRIKRRLSGNAGAPSSLAIGELAYNKVDDKLYLGLDSGIITLAGHGEYAKNSDLASEVSTLNAAISAEESRATAAESALGVRIDNVLSNIDPAALDSLTEVVSAFEAADSNLNNAITSLANTASSNLASAVATLEAADTTLQSNIDSEASTRAAAVTALEAADTTLQSNIDSEASTRASAISALDTRVVALESASADARLDEVESDIAAIESAATALTGRVSSLETTAAGLGTMSTQNANNVAITGGTIEGIEFDGGSF